jgi:O-antigen/teichoic acid export membrane protein
MKKEEQKEFNKSLKLIASSSVIIFITMLLAKVFSYVYRIIIARNFGPNIYGIFSLALMITGWFITFSVLGLNNGIVRFIPIYRTNKLHKKIQNVFNKSFLLVFIVSIIFFVVVFLFSTFISERIFNEPELSGFLRYFSVSIPLLAIFGLLISAIRAYEKVIAFSLTSKVAPNLLKVIFIFIFIYLGFNSNSIIFSYLLGSFGALLIALFLCIKLKLFRNPFGFKQEKNNFREVFFYSWPLLFSGLLNTVFHWTDSFVIGVFNSAAQVGFYNAALPIALLLSISPNIFNPMFFTLINKEYSKGNKETVKQLGKQTGKWIFMINFPILLFFIFFPGVFLNIFFGNEYVVAYNSLRFLSIGMFFLYLFIVSNRLIAMKGMSRIILYDMVGVSIFNLILNFLLVPKFGIVGASIATMISLIVLSLLFAYQSFRILKIIPLRRKLLQIIFSGGVAISVLIFLRFFIEINTFSVIFLGIIFLVIYISLIVVLKGLDKNDLEIAKSFIKKLKKIKK